MERERPTSNTSPTVSTLEVWTPLAVSWTMLIVIGATVTGQQFGVATSSSDLPVGLMGVGPGIELTGYPIIIDTLATQGVTKSRAFSLDLRSWESPDGESISCGVIARHNSICVHLLTSQVLSSSVVLIPPSTLVLWRNAQSSLLLKLQIRTLGKSPAILNQPNLMQYSYWIHMKSVGITKPGEVTSKLYAPSSSDPLGQPVFLDSGGTISRLPTALVNSIIADFPGATEDGDSGLYLVDCSVGDQAGTVDFGFGNTVINVPYSEFIWHIEGFCYLGIAVDDVTPVLGDSFLRAAFVVYDQDNQNLHLANAKNCGTNLVAIGTGPDAVPSVVGACGSSSTSSSSSSSATSSSTISSSASITSSVSAFPTISSNSTGLYPMSNHSSTVGPTAYPTAYTTSTVYSTSKYTVTSCPASVTNCPTGKVTQTVIQYTTVCPVTHAPTITSKPSYDLHTTEKTKTVYATKTYTISKCGPEVKNCPYGSTTTTVTPVSTSVHYISYAVTTVAGYTVAPYELVAHPVPIAPVVPIQYPVPVKPVPTGVKPGSYNPVTTPVKVPTAIYTPVGSPAPYPTVAPPASYAPTPAAASDFYTFSAVPSGALLPTGSGIPFTGAASSSMKVGNVWAIATIVLGLLVMV